MVFCLVVRLCVWFLVLCLFALRPGVGCWVPVSGALASSLVVGCCRCLPGSGFCAGFREKGRRPKNQSRRSSHAGLFQVFSATLPVLERRYRGPIQTLVHMVGYSPSSYLRRFLKSVSTRSQPTGGGRWKSLHMQSGLSVEVPSSASQRVVLSSSSASQFLVFQLSCPCSAGQGDCSRYPGVTARRHCTFLHSSSQLRVPHCSLFLI